MKRPLTYKASGVSYSGLDAFKRKAQKAGAASSRVNPSVVEMSQSRGESAYVWEEGNSYRALVMEGLGTKNIIADEMEKLTGKSYYRAIAQDTVAMIVNDLVVVGAAPQVVNAYFAVGDTEWFAKTKRTRDLALGFADACKMAGAVWGGGETPALKDILLPGAIDLAGSAVGRIHPKKRLTLGEKITSGDAIVFVESSGIHANGLTLARALATRLPKGYKTPIPDGQMYGAALLTPTHIYARLVAKLFEAGVDIHYMVNVTGHGWRKLMRATKAWTYSIHTVPARQPLFAFIQKHAKLSDREMYSTFNMGVGFALYMPKKHVTLAIQTISRLGLQSYEAGVIQKGKKQVMIKPLGITYAGGSLRVRA